MTRADLLREHILVRCCQMARGKDGDAFLARLRSPPVLSLAGRDKRTREEEGELPPAKVQRVLEDAEAVLAPAPHEWAYLPPEMQDHVITALHALADADPVAHEALRQLARVSHELHESVHYHPVSFTEPTFERLLDAVATNSPALFLLNLSEGTSGGSLLDLEEDQVRRLARAIVEHEADRILQRVVASLPYRRALPPRRAFYNSFARALAARVLGATLWSNDPHAWEQSVMTRALRDFETNTGAFKEALRLEPVLYAETHHPWYDDAGLPVVAGHRSPDYATASLDMLKWYAGCGGRVFADLLRFIALDDVATVAFICDHLLLPEYYTHCLFVLQFIAARLGSDGFMLDVLLQHHFLNNVDAANNRYVAEELLSDFVSRVDDKFTEATARVLVLYVRPLLSAFHRKLGLYVYENWGSIFSRNDRNEQSQRGILVLLTEEASRLESPTQRVDMITEFFRGLQRFGAGDDDMLAAFFRRTHDLWPGLSRVDVAAILINLPAGEQETKTRHAIEALVAV